MRKVITLLFILLLAGCSQQLGGDIQAVPDNLKLKAEKENIIKSEQKTIYIPVDPLDFSKDAEYIQEEIVEYDYISDEEEKEKQPYFSDRPFSKGEYKRKENGRELINFYSEDLWYKNANNKIYKIKKGATTTPEAFNEQTKTTLLDKVKYFFTGTPATAVDTYNSNDTWTPASTGTADILVVGGGGGGGMYMAGGGGAGGYDYATSVEVTAIEYTITVGAGGASGDNSSPEASRGGDTGSNSTFSGADVDTITGNGGGGGGSQNNVAGKNGGCGGGEPEDNVGFGSGSQGGDGGDGYSDRSGGGGGGMSENGSDSASGVGGDGGDGLANPIQASEVGENSGGTYYICGGGGGATFAYSPGTAGAGGLGGGGDGIGDTKGGAGEDGTANTGGGGGGSHAETPGGDGGSGVIVIDYTAEGGETTPARKKAQEINFNIY